MSDDAIRGALEKSGWHFVGIEHFEDEMLCNARPPNSANIFCTPLVTKEFAKANLDLLPAMILWSLHCAHRSLAPV